MRPAKAKSTDSRARVSGLGNRGERVRGSIELGQKEEHDEANQRRPTVAPELAGGGRGREARRRRWGGRERWIERRESVGWVGSGLVEPDQAGQAN